MDNRHEERWFWATLTLSSVTLISVVFATWELVENSYFRDADYITLHYLYITRGIASSLLVAFWAAWFVLRQKRRGEKELHASRERYRGLMEVFPGAVVLFDEQLRVMEWNASAERMYGFSKEEVYGQPLSIVPAERAGELQSMMRTVASGTPVLDVETLRQSREGEPFEVQLSLLPFEEPGSPFCYLEVASDIRDRVRWQRTMLEVEKLTSMGQMAAGTAHHLNSPLAALMLRVRMMQEQPAYRNMAGDLAQLESGLKFCRDFVQHLLEFTRRQPAHKEVQEVTRAVESVAAFFAPTLATKRVRFSLDTEAVSGRRILADRSLLEALLLILLGNALDAVDGEGEIRIECGCLPANRVRIAVLDNGRGIAAADLPRVFQPFFTTKPPGKGTGLGLAIARNLAADHGGQIRLESVPGSGTAAVVELPLYCETAAAGG